MIRPGVRELLLGVATQLDESVVPELASGSAARNQTRAAAAVLRRIAGVWDQVVPALLEEVDDLEGGLAAAARALAAGDPRRAALDAAIAAAPALDAAVPSFEAGASRHQALQRALDDGLSALEPGSSPAADAARAELLGVARRMAARSRRLSGR